jgi:hypothetical protein
VPEPPLPLLTGQIPSIPLSGNFQDSAYPEVKCVSVG